MYHAHAHAHGHMHRHARRMVHAAAGMLERVASPDQASRVLRIRGDCHSDTDPGCTKPTQVPTIAIAAGVIVPIVGLLIVLFFLHQRNKRRLAKEDAKDKYKSMDFGMDVAGGGKKNKKGPEMSVAGGPTHNRGVSLEAGSPYMLPVGLHGSRESFHSLSRSHNDPHDPYRPVTFIKDSQSVRTQSRTYRRDNGSTYTASSGGTERHRMGDGLLRNAQNMPLSSPDGSRSPESKFSDPAIPMSPLNPRPDNVPLPPPPPPPLSTPKPAPAAFTAVPEIAIPRPAAKAEPVRSPVQEPPVTSYPPRVQSQNADIHENHPRPASMISTSSYGDGFQVTPPSPGMSDAAHAPQDPWYPEPLHPYAQYEYGHEADEYGHNTNRLSILRPLPPDLPEEIEENPEQRANRIRSFYKEYFDDSRPEPSGGHTYTDYYEDYGSEYHQEGALFDRRSRAFIAAQPNAPYAAPVTRRAMTPPPRAPPRFRSGTSTGPHTPHMSNSSMSSSNYPPRNMSSMSGRMHPPAPRRPMPPPAALTSLPTPAKLGADAMVFNALDFAPPVSYRDRQNGLRPDSPLGMTRPYSPSVRPHTPLASSYDDLAAMPSPHMLRKSSTFTALDFAPPPRFRDPGSSNASDAGSIRSNRSGMSQASRFAIANGANRVSKIPKGVVFTKDDMLTQLRPKMDLTARA